MSKTTRKSTRVDGITVRETSRRRYEVDFSVTIGDDCYRFRRASPYNTVGRSREWARQHRAAMLERGGAPAKKQAPRADPAAARTFSYWATRYLEEGASPARRRGPNRAGTLVAKESRIRNHLLPVFGHHLVTSIDEEKVERLVEKKVNEEQLGSGHVRNILTSLYGVMRLARRRGNKIEQALVMPEVFVRYEPRKEIPTTLSERDTNRLLARAASLELDSQRWLYPFLCLLFRQGLRVGEVLGLRWQDIGAERLHVRKAWDIHGHADQRLGDTKGGHPRSIPLHHQTRAALERVRAPDAKPWHWVFPSPRYGQKQPRSYAGADDNIRAHVWEGLDFRDADGGPLRWHTHLGRHSLGRQWAERGWPIKGLQDLLGHEDLQTTMVYAHWAQSATDPLLQQLGSDTGLADRLREAGVTEDQLAAAGLTS